MSQIRSHGKRIKSDFIACCISGKRSNSAVPVVKVNPLGARTDGEGAGSDVRCGFCESAASRGP